MRAIPFPPATVPKIPNPPSSHNRYPALPQPVKSIRSPPGTGAARDGRCRRTAGGASVPPSTGAIYLRLSRRCQNRPLLQNYCRSLPHGNGPRGQAPSASWGRFGACGERLPLLGWGDRDHRRPCVACPCLDGLPASDTRPPKACSSPRSSHSPALQQLSRPVDLSGEDLLVGQGREVFSH